jgi:MYXO-CTERM domain-containing protein
VRISYDVVVKQPVDAVWQSLCDVDGGLAALPGAALARDADSVSGSLKCKLGPTQVTYRLTAHAEVSDPAFRTAVLTVAGEEARGSGILAAELTVALRAEDSDTRIEVAGVIDATGRGESADEAAWQRVIKLLLNALVPPTAPPLAAEPQPRVPLSVASQPPASSPASAAPLPAWVVVLAVLGLLALIVRRRSRTARKG